MLICQRTYCLVSDAERFSLHVFDFYIKFCPVDHLPLPVKDIDTKLQTPSRYTVIKSTKSDFYSVASLQDFCSSSDRLGNSCYK